jgi:hypothetical protein
MLGREWNSQLPAHLCELGGVHFITLAYVHIFFPQDLRSKQRMNVVNFPVKRDMSLFTYLLNV